MSNITTKQSVLLKGLSKKTVVAQFDQDHASSDAWRRPDQSPQASQEEGQTD